MDFRNLANSLRARFMKLHIAYRIAGIVLGLAASVYGVRGFETHHVVIHVKNNIFSVNSLFLGPELGKVNDSFMVVTSVGIIDKGKIGHHDKAELNKNLFSCKVRPGQTRSFTFKYSRNGQYGVFVGNKRGLALWFPVQLTNGNDYYIDLAYGSFALNGARPISSSF